MAICVGGVLVGRFPYTARIMYFQANNFLYIDFAHHNVLISVQTVEN